MELVAIYRELWRLRAAAAGVLVVALIAGLSVSYDLPSLGKRSLSYGAASTEVLVDAPSASLTSTTQDIGQLSLRAAVLARFMTSEAVSSAIARGAGVDGADVTMQGPVDPNAPESATQPMAEQRSSQVAAEGRRYRVLVQSQAGLPIVTIYAQAPDARAAEKLANSSVRALEGALEDLGQGTTTPARDRLRIQQLGPATGSTVSQSSSTLLALVVFLGVLAGGWAALIGGSRLLTRLRAAPPQQGSGKGGAGQRRKNRQSGNGGPPPTPSRRGSKAS